MKPLYPRMQEYSLIRSPAWRWERAQSLVSAGRYATPRRDDDWTRQAVHFLRDAGRCRRAKQLAKLARNHPDVFAARRLHEQGGDAVLEAQARLLAGQTVEDIARLTDLPSSVIGCYELLFYNVTDRLHARDWITTMAIGWWRFDPAKGRDPATILRAFAFHGGPVVLSSLLPYILGGKAQLPPVNDSASPESHLDRAIRTAIEIDMLPYDEKTHRKLSKLHLELHNRAGSTTFRRSSEEFVAQNLNETLDNLASLAMQQAPQPSPAAAQESVNTILGHTG